MVGETVHRTRCRSPLAARVSRISRAAPVIACAALLIVAANPSQLPAQTKNKNVRTWAWADEIVQPKSNAINRPSKSKNSSREVARQLLLAARKAAESGKLDVAEQLATRAEATHNSNLASGTDGWDPSEQTPNSFLRQLAAARAQQAAKPAVEKKSTQRRTLASAGPLPLEDENVAPAPPTIPEPTAENAVEPPAHHSHAAKGQPAESDTFKDHPSFGWSAKTDNEFPAPPSITADLDENGEGLETADSPQPLRNETPTLAQRARKAARMTRPKPAASEEAHDADDELPSRSAEALAAAVHPTTPVTTERIIQIRDPEEEKPRSRFTDALIQLLSTTAGLVLGILLLVGVRQFLKTRYNADFGFVFRVEHVATAEDGTPITYPFYPGMQTGEPLPMPTAGPGRNGAAAVLTELPSGFGGDELSPYEEELQKREEAECEMMKLVLQQNLVLREQINSRKESAA